MALYALALGYSNGIAPLIMGFINDVSRVDSQACLF